MKWATYVMLAGVFLLAISDNVWSKNNFVPPSEIVGTWEFEAKTFRTYFEITGIPRDTTNRRSEITIHEDGRVTGTIGILDLHDCRVKSNRGWLGRKLNIKSDYIVSGGYVPGKDPETGERFEQHFTIPFGYEDDKLHGGIMWTFPWKYPEPMYACPVYWERVEPETKSELKSME